MVIEQTISKIWFQSTTFIKMVSETIWVGLKLDWVTAVIFFLVKMLLKILFIIIVSIFRILTLMTAWSLGVLFSKIEYSIR